MANPVTKTATRVADDVIPIAKTAWTDVMAVALVLMLVLWVGTRVMRRKIGLSPL